PLLQPRCWSVTLHIPTLPSFPPRPPAPASSAARFIRFLYSTQPPSAASPWARPFSNAPPRPPAFYGTAIRPTPHAMTPSARRNCSAPSSIDFDRFMNPFRAVRRTDVTPAMTDRLVPRDTTD